MTTPPAPRSSDTYDRASGVLLGQACGDALGVPYEFAAPPTGQARMLGGGLGPYEPGEWSDDTQMAVCIAQVAATGADLTSDGALDLVAAAFENWRWHGASDVGIQTSSVMAAAANLTGTAGARVAQAAADLHARTGRTAGNGALMRTSIVGLTRTGDRDATAAAARAVAELTHPDPLAGDSSVLWCEAIRVAVLDATLDVRAGLDLIAPERRDAWAAWLDDAEQAHPVADLRDGNGFTVTALQAAWHAICSTPADGPEHASAALHAAVRIGGDTDTVAAIAGGLLGARWGAGAFPADWVSLVHGWPGLTGTDLVDLALATYSAGW